MAFKGFSGGLYYISLNPSFCRQKNHYSQTVFLKNHNGILNGILNGAVI